MVNLLIKISKQIGTEQRISLTNFFEQRMIMVITEFTVSEIYYLLRIGPVRLGCVKVYNDNNKQL